MTTWGSGGSNAHDETIGFLNKAFGYLKIAEMGAANLMICGWGTPQMFDTQYGRAVCMMALASDAASRLVMASVRDFTLSAMERGTVSKEEVQAIADDREVARLYGYGDDDMDVCLEAARLVGARRRFEHIPTTRTLLRYGADRTRERFKRVDEPAAKSAARTWLLLQSAMVSCCMGMAAAMGSEVVSIQLQAAAARLRVIGQQLDMAVSEGKFTRGRRFCP